MQPGIEPGTPACLATLSGAQSARFPGDTPRTDRRLQRFFSTVSPIRDVVDDCRYLPACVILYEPCESSAYWPQ